MINTDQVYDLLIEELKKLDSMLNNPNHFPLTNQEISPKAANDFKIYIRGRTQAFALAISLDDSQDTTYLHPGKVLLEARRRLGERMEAVS